jgi:hypothetical protein
MPKTNGNYASGDFKITWNGESLSTGHGSDQFLTATPNGPMAEMEIGADGNPVISKMADQGGVLTMTFWQTAETLKLIDKIAAAEMLVGEFAELPFAGVFTFEDPTGNMENFLAWDVTLLDRGSHEHQKAVGERTITWGAGKLIFGDPASIMAAMSQYIKN